MKEKAIIINLFGGPGSGKSTMRARIFTELKYKQLNCEEVDEYAKGKTWEESWGTLVNQIYVFGKQHHKMFRVMNKVDIVITDSPLLMSLHYDESKNEALRNLVLQQHNNMNTVNYFLERKHEYKTEGRKQTEGEANEVASGIRNILDENNVKYVNTHSSPDVAKEIADYVEKLLNKQNK